MLVLLALTKGFDTTSSCGSKFTVLLFLIATLLAFNIFGLTDVLTILVALVFLVAILDIRLVLTRFTNRAVEELVFMFLFYRIRG